MYEIQDDRHTTRWKPGSVVHGASFSSTMPDALDWTGLDLVDEIRKEGDGSSRKNLVHRCVRSKC